jgi:hypothetical protein
MNDLEKFMNNRESGQEILILTKNLAMNFSKNRRLS